MVMSDPRKPPIVIYDEASGIKPALWEMIRDGIYELPAHDSLECVGLRPLPEGRSRLSLVPRPEPESEPSS